MGNKKKTISNFEFTKLFNLVESGYTIDAALLELKTNRNKFYRSASEEQKQILKKLKLTQRTVFNLSLKNEDN
jgi:Ser/Thr protein kinase RdoA (MazF antagonist)